MVTSVSGRIPPTEAGAGTGRGREDAAAALTLITLVRAAGFYRAPLQNSYLKTVVAEKIIKFLYSFSQKAFHGEY